MGKKQKAILFMILSAFSFALMSALVKLAGDLPSYEKVFFRSTISMLVIFFIIKRKKTVSLFGKREHQKHLIFRSLLGTTAMLMFFYGIPYVYLADSAMIGKLNPFFVTLFAYLFLKEKLSKIQIPALIIIFLAALLIIKPTFDIKIIPYLALLGGAVFSAGGHTMLRALRKKEAPLTIVFYFSMVTSSILIIPTTINFVMPVGIQWLYLIGIGIMAVIGQLGLTYAYRLWLAAEVSIYGYTGILFSVLAGFIFYGEIPDWMSITGGLIIISVSLIVYYHKKEKLNLPKIPSQFVKFIKNKTAYLFRFFL
jgi:drug/metabolite transporter (DMT)-like permease